MKFLLLTLLLPRLLLANCSEPSANGRFVTTTLNPEINPPYGKIQIYYDLLAPYNPKKPTLLVINGGPGGDHAIIAHFLNSPIAETMNVVGFDHRGVGCTRSLEKTYPGYEANENGMSRAAADIEAIRRDLLGNSGKWFVYGVSYGSMLGQKYAIKYPDGIAGLILDSAFHDVSALEIGRKQYVQLFFLENAEVRALYEKFLAKYPTLRNLFLRHMRGTTYSYFGRTFQIKSTLLKLLEQTSEADVEKIIQNMESLKPPLVGMLRTILCEEIWDYPNPAAESNQYYWWMMHEECPHFKTHRNPMHFSEGLKKLSMRTFIWGGKYDPVTPIQSMREMRSLIPNSILWENPHVGHGLLSEKSRCAMDLLSKFVFGASNAELQAKADSNECQSAPSRSEQQEKRYWEYSGSNVPLL